MTAPANTIFVNCNPLPVTTRHTHQLNLLTFQIVSLAALLFKNSTKQISLACLLTENWYRIRCGMYLFVWWINWNILNSLIFSDIIHESWINLTDRNFIPANFELILYHESPSPLNRRCVEKLQLTRTAAVTAKATASFRNIMKHE